MLLIKRATVLAALFLLPGTGSGWIWYVCDRDDATEAICGIMQVNPASYILKQ